MVPRSASAAILMSQFFAAKQEIVRVSFPIFCEMREWDEIIKNVAKEFLIGMSGWDSPSFIFKLMENINIYMKEAP